LSVRPLVDEFGTRDQRVLVCEQQCRYPSGKQG
jgi:hypothetical protein